MTNEDLQFLISLRTYRGEAPHETVSKVLALFDKYGEAVCFAQAQAIIASQTKNMTKLVNTDVTVL
jgi:hypothetical protein